MAVLTISREIGSSGLAIGQRVAETLGYHLVDKDTLAIVLREYGFAEFEAIYDNPPNFWEVFNASRYKTVEMLTRAIHAFAKQDQVVLVGRGSFAVLQGYANVLNVRVKAPIRIRVNWLMDDQGIASPAEAYKQLRWMDRARANFVERNYGVSLDDMRHFDLVFDTGKVNADRIVSWLVEYVENSIVQIPVPTQNGKTTQHLDVDPVLADYLRERFPVRDRMVPAIAT